MSKIGIMADCSSGVEYAPFKNNVKIARTAIHFGNEELMDGIDITADQFYEKLSASDIVPSTSAPSISEMIRNVDEFRKEGKEDVIFFTISNGLSKYGSQFASLIQNDSLEDELGTMRVHMFDSNTACLMEGYNAHYAEILADKGYDVKTILEECEKFKKNTTAYFVVNDLKYLVKNGRLSSAAGLIGSALAIKPILSLGESGTIETFEKVRTTSKAYQRIQELIIDDAKDKKKVLYLVLHTGLKEDAEKFAEEVRSKVNNAVRVEVTTITPTVGCHIGNHLMGFARFILDDLKEEI